MKALDCFLKVVRGRLLMLVGSMFHIFEAQKEKLRVDWSLQNGVCASCLVCARVSIWCVDVQSKMVLWIFGIVLWSWIDFALLMMEYAHSWLTLMVLVRCWSSVIFILSDILVPVAMRIAAFSRIWRRFMLSGFVDRLGWAGWPYISRQYRMQETKKPSRMNFLRN